MAAIMCSSMMMSRSILFGVLSSALLLSCCCLADLVDEICSNSIDPPRCVSLYRSDARSKGGHIYALGLIAIDYANTDAQKGRAVVSDLQASTNDTKIQARYDTCMKNFQSAFRTLSGCRSSLGANDLKGLVEGAKSVIGDADGCDREFATPPNEDFRLKEAMASMRDFGHLIIVIANRIKI